MNILIYLNIILFCKNDCIIEFVMSKKYAKNPVQGVKWISETLFWTTVFKLIVRFKQFTQP